MIKCRIVLCAHMLQNPPTRLEGDIFCLTKGALQKASMRNNATNVHLWRLISPLDQNFDASNRRKNLCFHHFALKTVTIFTVIENLSL